MLQDTQFDHRRLDPGFTGWLHSVLRAPGAAVAERIDSVKMTALGAWATDQLGRQGAHAVEISWKPGDVVVQVSASFTGEGVFVARSDDQRRRSVAVMSAVSRIIDDRSAALRLLPPASGEAWWHVLGVSRDASRTEIDAAFRIRVKSTHPDAVGGAADMARLTAARDAARQVVH